MNDDNAPNNPFNTNTLLRRLLPVVCIGVVGNLVFSWYTRDAGKPQDWSKFSVAYLLLAALLSLLPWFWHGVRLAIWSRFFDVKISRLNLLRIATDVANAPPGAVAACKRLLIDGEEASLAEATAAENVALGSRYGSAENVNAVTAILNKGKRS